jgi:hypothetical protein
MLHCQVAFCPFYPLLCATKRYSPNKPECSLSVNLLHKRFFKLSCPFGTTWKIFRLALLYKTRHQRCCKFFVLVRFEERYNLNHTRCLPRYFDTTSRTTDMLHKAKKSCWYFTSFAFAVKSYTLKTYGLFNRLFLRRK